MKKLFIFLIFLFFAQPCFAEIESESADISSKTELLAFIDSCVVKRISNFVVNYANGYRETSQNILRACNLPSIVERVLMSDGIRTKVYYQIQYYPGMRIADAYLKNDTSNLTPEEMVLYSVATSLLDQAASLPPLEAELFFHDTICRTVQYYTSDIGQHIPRHATAIGALIDRRANCQGYTDAFAMLCRMYGFNVYSQSGLSRGKPHVWNVIQIDNRWYAVDVTWDDNDDKQKHVDFISHKYFNIPEELLRSTHSWNRIDELCRIEYYLDENYYYMRNNRNFGYTFSDKNKAVQFLVHEIIRNTKVISIMIEDNDTNHKNFIALLKNGLMRARRSVNFYCIYQTLGNYSYYTIALR